METPREALRRRRNAYLARVSIFDTVESDPRVDRRPARSRGFFAGGDDIPEKCLEDPGVRPIHRPPRASGKAEEARNLRRHNARTGESDWDQFSTPMGPGGHMTLYRITAVLMRACELIREGVPLAPAAVLDLLVTRLPKVDDTEQSLTKAWALLKLCGYDWNELHQIIGPKLDAPGYGYDEWEQLTVEYAPGLRAPKYTSLRDEVVFTVWRVLDSYLAGYPPFTDTKSQTQRPSAPPENQPAKALTGAECTCWPGVDPAAAPAGPKPPERIVPPLLVADEAAHPNLRDAMLAAVGTVSPEELVELLRRLTFAEPAIARLLLFIRRNWQAVPDDWRWYLGTIMYQNAPTTPEPPDQSPPQDDEAFRRVALEWRQIVELIQTLIFLGNCTRNTVREVCIRLAMLVCERNSFTKLSPIYLLDPVRFEDPEDLYLAGIRLAGQGDDCAFQLALLRYTEKKLLGDTYHRNFGVHQDTYPLDYKGPLSDKFSAPTADDPISAFYWRSVVIPHTFQHILGLVDTADFAVAEHLRFLGHFRRGGVSRPRLGDRRYHAGVEAFLSKAIPDWFIDVAVASLVRFKYWVTDAPTPNDGDVEMTFWSENHQVLFASGEYLAGQFWPDERFTHAVNRDGGTLTGREHQERAKGRLERWLHDRLRFGFAEMNSPVYYNEHLPAVFNVVDFAADQRLRTLASMVLDLLVFDVVRHSCQGSFIAATSRVYLSNKSSGWAASIGDFGEVLTGRLGDVGGPGEDAAVCLATSSYLDTVPEVLIAIALTGAGSAAVPDTVAVPVIARSRVSISYADGEKYGIGTESSDDILFWWSHSAYFTEPVWRASQSWSYRWNLRSTGPFALFDKIDWAGVRFISAIVALVETAILTGILMHMHPLIALSMVGRLLREIVDLILSSLDLAVAVITSIAKEFELLDEDDDRIRVAKPLFEQEIERLAGRINGGSVIEREHLYLWRSNDAQLSSLVDEKPGQFSAQKEACIANLGPSVSVFVSKPLEPQGTGATFLDAVGGFYAGLGGDAELWETYPAVFDAGSGSAMPELSGAAVPILLNAATDDIFGDGPKYFQGQVSNPSVWQHENVAIAIFRTTREQREISHRTHAFWPWEHFDEVRTEERAGGRWVFGRRDRRFPPRTPCQPYDAALGRNWWPSAEVPWPNHDPVQPESTIGSGYVAVFSANGMKTTPAVLDDEAWLGLKDGDSIGIAAGWGHRELIADGHDNIWIIVVGDRETYGSFDAFVADVLAEEPKLSVADSWCTVITPIPGAATGKKGRKFEVNFVNGAKLDDEGHSTEDWPRFELAASTLAKEGTRLPYGITSRAEPDKRRVDFDETAWRIEATVTRLVEGEPEPFTLWLTHDFKDLDRPFRQSNVKPPDTPKPDPKPLPRALRPRRALPAGP